MRFISEQIDGELFSIMNAIQKDRGSWQGWHYLKIEILADIASAAMLPVHNGIRHILDIYLADRKGTTFLCESHEIHIFCQNVSEESLETMGSQILELIREHVRIAARYAVYDVFQDHDRIIALHRRNYPLKENQALIKKTRCEANELTSLLGPKVLLVEDDPVTRWMVKTALKGQCRLSIASNAKKGLAAYQANRPDIVLLDINLPDKDGRETMMRIITSDPGAYVVMFSSHDSLENIACSLEKGAKGFIAKPFNKDQLLHYIHTCPGGVH